MDRCLVGISRSISNVDEFEEAASLLASGLKSVFEENCLLERVKEEPFTTWWNENFPNFMTAKKSVQRSNKERQTQLLKVLMHRDKKRSLGSRLHLVPLRDQMAVLRKFVHQFP